MFATPVEPAREPFSGTNAQGKAWTLRKQKIAFHDDHKVPGDIVGASQLRTFEVLVPVDSDYTVGKTYRVSCKTIYQKDRGISVGTFVLID